MVKCCDAIRFVAVHAARVPSHHSRQNHSVCCFCVSAAACRNIYDEKALNQEGFV